LYPLYFLTLAAAVMLKADQGKTWKKSQ